MHSCRYQSRDMRHIHHQVCTHLIGDLPEFFKINHAGISAGSCHDQLRAALSGDSANLFIVDEAIVVDSIRMNLKIFSGQIGGASMGQMPAVSQVHAHHLISRLQHSKKYGHIRLRAGMRLYIGICAAKDFFGTLYSQTLHFVHTSASAVIPFSRISFRIFIGQRASHSRHHGLAYPVF